ncbi:hypothetical protein KIPB_012720 [Kipferlia bialata]|uniref:Uncharacterized protein n=1 Tax=Kipferlia bialata TaxID=797122 RepID=A0A9K3GP07_9EUKA|nr:hypothetical protein KIPB_012720 [Kipferlia bialata]|eukprot:g12720.t1
MDSPAKRRQPTEYSEDDEETEVEPDPNQQTFREFLLNMADEMAEKIDDHLEREILFIRKCYEHQMSKDEAFWSAYERGEVELEDMPASVASSKH